MNFQNINLSDKQNNSISTDEHDINHFQSYLNGKKYAYVLEHMQDAIFEWDRKTGIIYCSDTFEKKFGYTINGKVFPQVILQNDYVHPLDLQEAEKFLDKEIVSQSLLKIEFRLKTAEGKYIWIRTTSTPISDEHGEIIRLLGIIYDINAEKTETLTAKELAMKDHLTGLLNRMATEQLVDSYIKNGGSRGAMFIIDIDDFKRINDTSGHRVGDVVLKKISSGIKSLFRANDIIGRLGGDEFVLFMTNIGENYNIKKRAKDVVKIMQSQVNTLDTNLTVTGSVGISMFPKDGKSFAELYEKADIALYRSKSYGKNIYTVYDKNFKKSFVDTGLAQPLKNNTRTKVSENILKNSEGLVYVTDSCNYRILYISDLLKKEFKINESVQGKRCHEVFFGLSAPCENCNLARLRNDDFYEREVKVDAIGKTFLLRGKLVQWNNIPAHMEVAIDITKSLEQREKIMEQSNFKKVYLECIQNFHEENSLPQGVVKALEKLSVYYNCDGAIVHNITIKDKEYTADGNVYQLCGSKFKKKPMCFQAPIEKETVNYLSELSQRLSAPPLLSTNDLPNLNEINLQLIEKFNFINGFFINMDYGEGTVIVTLYNPKKNIERVALFDKVVRYIEKEYEKNNIKQKLAQEKQRYYALIENMADSVFEYDTALDELSVYISKISSYSVKKEHFTIANASKNNMDRYDLCYGISEQDISHLRDIIFGKTALSYDFKRGIDTEKNCIWINVRSSVVIDDDGKIVKVIGTFKNVTEKYEKEDIDSVNAWRHNYEYNCQHDALTGLYTKYGFYKYAQKLIQQHQLIKYAIIRFDVNKFKMLNRLFGISEGDRLLILISQNIIKFLEQTGNAVGARFNADVFYICMPYSQESLSKLKSYMEDAAQSFGQSFEIIYKYGVYIVEDVNVPIDAICDDAAIAQSEIKTNFLVNTAFYDNKLRYKIIKEQKIVREMKTALEKGYFHIYLQPKVDITSGKILGAEALARWVCPDGNIISPQEFIPIFEKNGFIMQLDYYIWEKTCILLKHLADTGRPQYPISVNISRINLYNPKLCSSLVELVEKYNIPKSLLQLEITESAYVENEEGLIEVTEKLQKYGFSILMDDFGSGFSSLNMLQNLPVDALKIDMKFLSGAKTTGKGANILASVIRMAKWLNLPIIVEGVETKEQSDFLKSMGCRMAQGFYYAKPMTEAQYEKVLDHCDERIISDEQLVTIPNMSIDEMWAPDAQVNLLFNAIVTAVFMAEYSTGRVELLRVNDGYYDLMGFEDSHAREMALQGNAFSWIVPEDKDIVVDMFEQAVATKATSTAVYRRYNAKKEVIWINVKLKYLGGTGNRHMLYGAIVDVTNEKSSQNMRKLNEGYYNILQSMLKASPEAISVFDFSKEGWPLKYANNNFYKMYEFSEEDISNENKQCMELVEQSERCNITKAINDAIGNKETSITLKFHGVTKRGKPIEVISGCGIALTDEGIIITAMDVQV